MIALCGQAGKAADLDSVLRCQVPTTLEVASVPRSLKKSAQAITITTTTTSSTDETQ